MLEVIKCDVISAMKNKETVKRDILRVIIGEIQNLEATGKTLSDEKIHSLIRKQIEGNNELIKCGHSESVKLAEENKVLENYLPATLSQPQIKNILLESDIVDDIRAGGTGKGMGLAMKHLKGAGFQVLGSDVKLVVEELCL